VSDVQLRFAERDGGRYRIELSGTVSASVLGHPERFELSAWADELPDHTYRGSWVGGSVVGPNVFFV